MRTHGNTGIKAIIVDDELVACKNLQYLLARHTEVTVNIAGVARDTTYARVLLEQHAPDVVFLDIDMPNETGLDFLVKMPDCPFEVIFVTAYDEYAINAFKLNAIDYILKPVNPDELYKAVKKVYEKVLFKEFAKKHPISYHALARQIYDPSLQDTIVLKNAGDIEVVAINNVIYVAADGSYSKIAYLQNGKEKHIIMSYPIADYEKMLPGNIFFRIHKSYLVNCNYISRLVKEEQAFAVLNNDCRLPVSRRRNNELVSFLATYNYIA